MQQPLHTLIQITDVHLTDVTPAPHGHDTVAVLENALRAVEDSGVTPSAIVFTGDLTDHGSPTEYQRLRAVVEPAAARMGAPAVFVAGNHDVRAPLREHLLGEPASDAPLDHRLRIGDLRVVVLDSSVPGRGYGELDPAQLDWLRAELAEPAPHGTVLALHHPPLPSADPLAAVIPLRRREQLAAVIEGTDVRAILAGHTHVVSAGVLAGVPVWTGGAIAGTMHRLAGGGVLRDLAAPAVSRIDVFDDAVIITSVPLAAEVLNTLPAGELAALVERLGAELPA
ncbi:metallophosphoesterase family protein [Pseudonocardia sp. GCM10023141]|uniref:metallophosphoesterase family protein n=1 Tax=Pseudonocardia sp. GCM10023141 TaxID=3252653 RepID=UPI003608999D